MYVRKTYQDWMNWPEYWKNLPKTKEFTGILGKLTRLFGILTKNIWISRNIWKTYQERIICQIIGNTYQEQLNIPEYWENLPRTNELTGIFGLCLTAISFLSLLSWCSIHLGGTVHVNQSNSSFNYFLTINDRYAVKIKYNILRYAQ